MDEEPGPDLNEGVTFDLVSNYSNSQIFQCLTTNVKTIPDFKNKLLNLWGRNTNQVNTLFSHYGF